MMRKGSFLRRTVTLVTGLILVMGSTGFTFASSTDDADPPVVLVWGGSFGFRHPSITSAEATFTNLGLQTGEFIPIITENPATLNSAVLSQVDAVAWVSTTGKPPFTDQQREDIIRFAYCGGGTLAFHAAADSNYGWPEYAELLGAQFDSHPKGAGSGEARMIVEDNEHPITEGWAGQEDFMMDDEYYRWRTSQGLPGIGGPRALPDTHVLLSLDEETVGGGIQEGPLAYEHHQPIAWTKTFRGGGRVYYNNMGHSDSTWNDPAFMASIANGIEWVTEKSLDQECYASDEPMDPPQPPPAPDRLAVGKPCVLPAKRPRTGGFTWERSGEIKTLTEDGDSMSLPTTGLPGNLSWGAQFYQLDLRGSGAWTADIDVTLGIPSPLDDYDLSVTTGWGWYGSQAPQGAEEEHVTLTDVPHCAILQMYGDNLYGVSQGIPTLDVVVTPDPVPPGDDTTGDEHTTDEHTTDEHTTDEHTTDEHTTDEHDS